MKKCIMVLFIILTIILSFSHEISAYATDDFSIYIPSSYTNNGENSFTDSNGNNLNIVITTINSPENFRYDEETLNYIVNSQQNIEKEVLRKMLIEEYSNYFTTYEIYELLNSINFHTVEQEITTFSKNNYKCFHLKYKMSINDVTMCYGQQYLVCSNDKAYIVTATSESNILNSDLQAAIDSFTIKNFKELGNDFSIFEKAGLAFISTFIIGFVYDLYIRLTKKKQNNYEAIIPNNFEYCIYCGKPIDTGSKFCQYCGAKIDTKEEVNL